jgi:hypothetical protein
MKARLCPPSLVPALLLLLLPLSGCSGQVSDESKVSGTVT